MNYKPNKFAEMLGVSVKTLQRWDVEGKLKAYRTPSGRRFYTDEQYSAYMAETVRKANWVSDGNGICYCSECGNRALYEIDEAETLFYSIALSKYCPHCGCVMFSEEK